MTPLPRMWFIWFMIQENVTALRCVRMRNVACISASCIPQIPGRLLWDAVMQARDCQIHIGDTEEISPLKLWIIMRSTNLPSHCCGKNGKDKNWGMFSSFSSNSGPGGHEDMRNVSQRLDVITASRVQCPPSSESRCYPGIHSRLVSAFLRWL